jgi:hypothetical protein
MATSFRELLSQETDKVERPRALAVGHYMGEIKGHEFGHSRNKQTPYVRFLLTPESECPDVTPTGGNDGVDLTRKELRKDFYITPAALYRLSDMLDAVLGQESGRTFDERIPDTRGAKVMFAVSQRENEEGTETFNDIGSIVKA